MMRRFATASACAIALLAAGCVAAPSTTPPTPSTPPPLAPPSDGSNATDPAANPAPTVPSPFAAAPGGHSLLVVATASVQGYVEPCGCTGDPLGGVARLAALLQQARTAWGDRVLFVDGGDLLFEKETDNAAVDRCQAEARTELLVSSYANAGLAVTTRGPLDDVRGAKDRDALLAKHSVTSVEHGEGIVVRRGDVDVLVVGLADDADLATAATTIATFRSRAAATANDVVVVLAQRDLAGARAVATALDGVDVVIVGRAGEAPSPPEQVHGAVIVQPGWQAQHVAAIDVVTDGRVVGSTLPLDDRQATADGRTKLLDVRIAELDKLLAALPPGATADFQRQRRTRFADERDAIAATAPAPMSGPHIAVRPIALRRGMAEEPAAAAALVAYTKAIPTLVSQCEAGVSCPEPPADVPRFVGATTCQTCHAAAWDFWQKALVEVPTTTTTGEKRTHLSGHVKAMATLTEVGRDTDRSCVGCHSAGFDQPGGACTTSQLKNMGLGAVQCESCHGAGSVHVQRGGDRASIAGTVPEARCRQCHLPPHIQSVADFVYDDRLLLILGEGHGAATAARLRSSRGAP